MNLKTITIADLSAEAARLAGRPVPTDARATCAAQLPFAYRYGTGWTSLDPDGWRDTRRTEDTARAWVSATLTALSTSAGTWPGTTADLVAYLGARFGEESPTGPLRLVDEAALAALAARVTDRAAAIWLEVGAPAPVAVKASSTPRSSSLAFALEHRAELAALGCDEGPLVFRTFVRDASSGEGTVRDNPALVLLVDAGSAGEIGRAMLRAIGVAARAPVAVKTEPAVLLHGLRGTRIDPDLYAAIDAIGTRAPSAAMVLAVADEHATLYRWGASPEVAMERPLADPTTRWGAARRG